MALAENVQSKLMGNEAELGRRTAVLTNIVKAFGSGGAEAIKTGLLKEAEAFEERYEGLLAKLRGML
jgi:hypothetical protein